MLQCIKSKKTLTRIAFILAISDFKLRNENSILGVLWYLLNPLLLFGLLLFVFTYSFGSTIPHYPLYLLLGIIMFNFFQFITIESTRAIHYNKLILRALPLPPYVVDIAIVIRTTLSHFFELLIFYIISLVYNIPAYTIVWYVLILCIYSLFCYSCALIFSMLTIYFMDLENIWLFAIRLLWFATPIFYSTKIAPQVQALNIFNPLYFFITAARDLIIYNHFPELYIIQLMLLYTILFFVISQTAYKYLKNNCIERL